MKNLDIRISTAPSKSLHIDIVRIDDINDSRIVEGVHILSEVTSDVVDELIKFSTPTLNEIYVHEESVSDVHDVLVESSTPSHNVRCSLSTSIIEEEIEHAIVTISVDASEYLEFFPIVCQVTPSVSSFNDCLEFFSEFFQTSVGPNNVILLEVFDVRHPRKLIYLIFVSVGILSSEIVALHLSEIYDETRRQITSCNDDYKFVAFSHSILQEFVAKKCGDGCDSLERFPLGTISLLLA